MVLTKMNTAVDIIDILGSIKVPALIMLRINDIDVKIEEGRFIAERIKLATSLLKDPRKKVKEVYMECGFNSLSYFIRTFRQKK